MSSVLIRAALESALAGMSPPISLAYENAAFTPVTGTPYASVNLLMARPTMLEMDQRLHREQGFMQVTLRYPLNAGPSAAQSRAEAIRSTFYAGRSLTASGVTVTIDGTPHIAPAAVDADRFVLPIRINFYAHIQRN